MLTHLWRSHKLTSEFIWILYKSVFNGMHLLWPQLEKNQPEALLIIWFNRRTFYSIWGKQMWLLIDRNLPPRRSMSAFVGVEERICLFFMSRCDIYGPRSRVSLLQGRGKEAGFQVIWGPRARQKSHFHPCHVFTEFVKSSSRKGESAWVVCCCGANSAKQTL